MLLYKLKEDIWLKNPMAAAIGRGCLYKKLPVSMVVDINLWSSCYFGCDCYQPFYPNRRYNGWCYCTLYQENIQSVDCERTAEEIKITIGTAMELEEATEMEIRGRDLVTGLPKKSAY